LRQDTDTLDTWFSSGMWTFSTLLDPDFGKYRNFDEWKAGSPDFQKFHPTTVLETAYDLIFFWVARMVLMTTYAVGQVPFENVYFGGLVRDKEGRKMSKSLGNGINPIEMIDKYGTDALRLSYVIGSTPGNDLKVYEEKIENYRNFVNKLWNISRYILLSVEDVHRVAQRPAARTLADEWILGQIDLLVSDVCENLENYRFSPAGEAIYDFACSKLADWYLEIAKVEGSKDEILLYVLERLLIVLHPFAPFVTEELWKNFGPDKMLLVEEWPEGNRELDAKAEADFLLLQEIITALRNIRSEYGIEPAKKAKAVIAAKDAELIQSQAEVIKRLGRLEELEIVAQLEKSQEMAVAVLRGAEVGVKLGGLVDLEKEKENLLQEKQELERYVRGLESKLSNETFVSRAPAEIVEGEKRKLEEGRERLARLCEKLSSLS
jgi:valyl-tRNA synthetase